MEAPNPAQIAPGEEAGRKVQDTPFRGFDPELGGPSMNGSFWQGYADAKAK